MIGLKKVLLELKNKNLSYLKGSKDKMYVDSTLKVQNSRLILADKTIQNF